MSMRLHRVLLHAKKAMWGYWMHNGHVTYNNEKMSKSMDNFFTISQVTERYHPLALRHFLMSAHYLSPLNYTILKLESASDGIFYIYQEIIDTIVVVDNARFRGGFIIV